MSSSKALHEMALKVERLLGDLPLHERAAVLGLVGTVLQAEAKSAELAQLQGRAVLNSMQQAAVADEHYPQ